MTAFDEGAGVERDLAWLLDDLASRVPDFKRAVILSRDGLLLAASQDLSREDAEHLSAVAAALQSLAAGTGERFRAGGVRQTVIELEQGLLYVIAAGEGSCLAALCPADADAGMVAYEMAMLVKRARPHLASHPRFPVRPAAFPSSPAAAELACRATAAIPCGGARDRCPASGSAVTPGRWSARMR